MTALVNWRQGAPFQASGVGTNSGVTVSVASLANATRVVTAISGSGDAAALVTIESPAATVIWRKRFTAAFTFSESFPPGAVSASPASAVQVKISASTSNCEANISGYDAI